MEVIKLSDILGVIMNNVLKYFVIFTLTVLILFSALVVSSMIPRSAIEDNLKESAEFYKTRSGIYRIKNKKIYSYIHYYADTRKLNVMYYIDSEKPIQSTLWSKYYQVAKKDTNTDFIDAVENSRESNVNYLRYWNGCMLFIRPMLIVFNIQQIYFINKVLLSILLFSLFMGLFKKSKKLAIVLLLALILVSIWYVTFCIEYSVMLYVMIITSIIAIKIDNNKKNKLKEDVDEKLSRLFLITGIVTTFFDFLTTELLTIFVPLLFILMIRKEEERLGSLKEILKFTSKAFTLWFAGYAGMWLAKWILSSIILNINAFEYVKENFALRFNGLQGLSNYDELYNNVIERNFFAIPIMGFIKSYFYKWEVKCGLILLGLLTISFINWKELKNKKYLLIFLLIGLTPYIRYLILANHSFRHAMFTYRDQIITIMCFLYIIIESLNYKLLLGTPTKMLNIIKRSN